MGRIVVITTGGTISARRSGTGYRARATGREVLARTAVPPAVSVELDDLCVLDGPSMTTGHQLALLRRIHEVLARPEVGGIVVTHGTDTLEESAFLSDLHHHDPRPVVFTGAMHPMDSGADGGGDGDDGPGNLHDAVLTASAVSGLGTLVVFGGKVFAARGTVKYHTVATDAFAAPGSGPIGEVRGETVSVHALPRRTPPLPPLTRTVPELPLRVDVVTHHADADPMLLRAAVAGGAQGVVLVGSGAGNATPPFVEAVAEATARGVLVALSTRVPVGPVAELATNGGAVDLVAAGAVPAGTLRAGQTRTAVLSALLATAEPAERRRALAQALGVAPAPVATP
ncbi:asparaginase [Kitasatospora purpeofusca]|uniref:asparaginase n=1 Tax=Kitasatospora purpeofusca TaxID=67352 RepID=UPI003F4A977D